MTNEIEIDSALLEVFKEADLVQFQNALVFDMQLTRLDHFLDVTDQELMSCGLSAPAIRRLRSAVEKHRKLAKKSKLFNGQKRVRILRNPQAKNQLSNQTNDLLNELSSLPYLIAKDEVKLMETLGEGTFAVVKRAIWRRSDGAKLDCAVKILHDMSEQVRTDLVAEISSMQRLRHQNLVQLFGVVFDSRTLMVMEYCDGGSLLNRLRDQIQERLLLTNLLKYAQQIANGMTYLESRRFVHRDLAARNVLLTQNYETVKICDFGLTRSLNENEHLYVMTVPKKVPFSWCPPESLRFRQFSHKSDIWAFGVTLWELYTYGEEPWVGCHAVDVLKFIEVGKRLSKPEFCPKEIYEVMEMCWNLSAESRPKFAHLRNLLQDIKFMSFVCRQPHSTLSDQELNLCVDDEVILVGEHDASTWFGQNVRTRKFGIFPRSAVAIVEGIATQSPQQGNGSPQVRSNSLQQFSHRREISYPIRDSMIHTGHGDIDESKCWGYVDHIDQIYLKNPLVNPNLSNENHPQKVAFVPSILSLSQTQPAESGPETSRFSYEPGASMFSDFSSASSKYSTYSTSSLPRQQNVLSMADLDKLWSSQFDPQRAQNSTQGWVDQELSRIGAIVMAPPPTKISQPSENSGNSDVLALSNNSKTGNCSKYDSAISIPRPNRSSPTIRSARVTPPIVRADNFLASQQNETTKLGTKPSATSLPGLATEPTNNTFQDNQQAIAAQLTAKHTPTNPGITTLIQNATINQDQASQKYLQSTGNQTTKITRNEDPFEVDESVKTLTSRLRYNDVHQQLAAETTITTPTLPLTSAPIAPVSSAVVPRPSKLSSNANVAVVQPFRSNQFTAQKPTQSLPEKKPSNSGIGSLLPPPSDLLLYGINSNTSSTSKIDLDRFLAMDNPKQAQQQPLKNQPIFDISSHTPTGQQHSQFSRIRYGSNGIPILEPVPAANTASRMFIGDGGSQKAPPVDLSELDTDAMVSRVHGATNFTSREDCRKSLLRNGFNIDGAIRDLKLKKLMEMGFSDRNLAISALDSCQWDVNVAIDRLLTS